MYNLNYNVTNARLNRPVGRPFVPTPRADPFSSSIVLAVPGAIFRNGYVNVFNQINAYDDISAYIKFGSILDENTGAYISNSATHSMSLITGSLSTGSYTASSTVVAFSGYEQSVFFTGSKCVQVSPDTGSTDGINLSATKAFVIEGWVAFAVSSSVTGSVPSNFQTYPQRQLAQKYLEGGFPIFSSSYLAVAGWGGPTGGDLDNPQYLPQSASLAFFTDDGTNGSIEEVFLPTSSSQFNALQFKHYAVSSTPAGEYLDRMIIRLYVNGVRVLEKNSSFGINPAITTPTYLFGDEGNAQTLLTQGQEPGAFYQDFRMYNGTNKNYTGSQFQVPPSMIIGKVEPYPQYT